MNWINISPNKIDKWPISIWSCLTLLVIREIQIKPKKTWRCGMWIIYLSWVKFTQSCPTLCDPMDCSASGSSVHGILQAKILEWFAILFSRGSSWPKDRTFQVSCIAGRFFTIWATRESYLSGKLLISLKGSLKGRGTK